MINGKSIVNSSDDRRQLNRMPIPTPCAGDWARAPADALGAECQTQGGDESTEAGADLQAHGQHGAGPACRSTAGRGMQQWDWSVCCSCSSFLVPGNVKVTAHCFWRLLLDVISSTMTQCPRGPVTSSAKTQALTVSWLHFNFRKSMLRSRLIRVAKQNVRSRDQDGLQAHTSHL